MATENKAAKRGKNTGVKVLLCLVILALLLGAGALIASRNYLLLDGHLYKRNTPELDLRGSAVTVEEYEALRASLPETAILWDVPLSGGAYDQSAESIAINSFTADDLDKLAYFTDVGIYGGTAEFGLPFLIIFIHIMRKSMLKPSDANVKNYAYSKAMWWFIIFSSLTLSVFDPQRVIVFAIALAFFNTSLKDKDALAAAGSFVNKEKVISDNKVLV